MPLTFEELGYDPFSRPPANMQEMRALAEALRGLDDSPINRETRRSMRRRILKVLPTNMKKSLKKLLSSI